MSTVISLRKFSRIAPTLTGPVQIRHEDTIIGAFTPVPRPAQEGSIVPPAVASPARTTAPVRRAASLTGSKSAPTGAAFTPAPKPRARHP